MHRTRTIGNTSGRAKALALLDQIMGKASTRKAFGEALEARFEEDPVRFFRTVIMPLLPRNATLLMNRPRRVEWRSLIAGLPVDGKPKEESP